MLWPVRALSCLDPHVLCVGNWTVPDALVHGVRRPVCEIGVEQHELASGVEQILANGRDQGGAVPSAP